MATIYLTGGPAKVKVEGRGATIIVGRRPEVSELPASSVTIEDAGGFFDSDNVEGALQEIGADIATNTSAIATNAGNISDLETALSKLSASEVAVVDAGNYYTGTEVESVLQEIGAEIFRPFDQSYIAIGDENERLVSGGSREVGGVLENSNGMKSPRFKSDIQTLSISGGLIAWNMELGQRAKVTLTGNATLSNPTNADAAFPDLEVRQDATGGRVLSFGSNFVLPTSFSAVATTANSYALYHFQLRSDGKFAVAVTHYTS